MRHISTSSYPRNFGIKSHNFRGLSPEREIGTFYLEKGIFSFRRNALMRCYRKAHNDDLYGKKGSEDQGKNSRE